MKNKAKSVFEELGYSEDRVLILKQKAFLMDAIGAYIKVREYTQKELQKLLGIPQPRVSELTRGKISKFSIEKLMLFLSKLDCKPEIKITFPEDVRSKIKKQKVA